MNINPPSGGIHLPFFKQRDRATREDRVPGFQWLPNKIRNHFIGMLGEFCGTFLFLFFAFSATQVANAAASGADTDEGTETQVPNASTLLYISLAFGFSLAVNAWVFFRISGKSCSVVMRFYGSQADSLRRPLQSCCKLRIGS